ncbi:MAG: hypothetical protein ACTSX7_01460 [Alphaproteobacteria bacterium]
MLNIQKLLLSSLAAFGVLFSLTAPLLAYSGEDYYVCKLNPKGDNYLSLRSCGSTKCTVIMRLGPDYILTSLEPYNENGWREVVTRGYAQDDTGSGTTGWVHEKYICPMD